MTNVVFWIPLPLPLTSTVLITVVCVCSVHTGFHPPLVADLHMDCSVIICSLVTNSFLSTLNYGCVLMALFQLVAGSYAGCVNTSHPMLVATPWEQGVLLP